LTSELKNFLELGHRAALLEVEVKELAVLEGSLHSPLVLEFIWVERERSAEFHHEYGEAHWDSNRVRGVLEMISQLIDWNGHLVSFCSHLKVNMNLLSALNPCELLLTLFYFKPNWL